MQRPTMSSPWIMPRSTLIPCDRDSSGWLARIALVEEIALATVPVDFF
jgi:hypothetical protein